MKSTAIFFCLFLFFGTVCAQEDSTDLNFTGVLPSSLSEEDSLFVSGTDLVELSLEFDLDDESFTLGKVWVELILLPDDALPVLLVHNAYTLSELEAQSLMTGSTVTIPFGWYSAQTEYEVAIRLEDTDGNQVRLITKQLTP